MRKNPWVLLTAVLGTGAIIGLGSAGVFAQKPDKPGERGGRHPQMHAAMRALHQAAHHLEHAEHHFGGHRAKALELVKQAENELQEALEYAKTYPPTEKPGASGKPATTGKTQ